MHILKFFSGRLKGTAKALEILGRFGYSMGQYPSVDKAKAFYEEHGKG